MSHDNLLLRLCIQLSMHTVKQATCISDNHELQMHHAFSIQYTSQTTTPYHHSILGQQAAE